MHLLIFVDGLLRRAQIIRRVHAGNVLRDKRRGQIHAGIDQGRIQLNGLLKVVDGLLVVVVLVGFHALVELVARPQLVASHRGEERQRSGCQRDQSSAFLFIAV